MKLSLEKITTAVTEARDQLGLAGNPETRCFLLDMSSSMNAMDAGEVYGTKSRFTVLSEVIEQYPNENLVGFATDAFFINEDIRNLYPNGSTNMAAAISFCLMNGYKHIILVTDGRPDNEFEVMQVAPNVERLDIIYAGPQPAPEFLSNLANQSGGNVSYSNCSFKLPKQLTQKITGLIGSARKESIKL